MVAMLMVRCGFKFYDRITSFQLFLRELFQLFRQFAIKSAQRRRRRRRRGGWCFAKVTLPREPKNSPLTSSHQLPRIVSSFSVLYIATQQPQCEKSFSLQTLYITCQLYRVDSFIISQLRITGYTAVRIYF